MEQLLTTNQSSGVWLNISGLEQYTLYKYGIGRSGLKKINNNFKKSIVSQKNFQTLKHLRWWCENQ